MAFIITASPLWITHRLSPNYLVCKSLKKRTSLHQSNQLQRPLRDIFADGVVACADNINGTNNNKPSDLADTTPPGSGTDLPEYYTPLSDDGKQSGTTDTASSSPNHVVNRLRSVMDRTASFLRLPFARQQNPQEVGEPSGTVASPYDFVSSFTLSEAEEAARDALRYGDPKGGGAQDTQGLDVIRASRALWKIGWFAWWTQLVLTVVAAVIVLFAFAFPGVSIRTTSSAAGFVCAGVGVMITFVSLFWTYGFTRLAIRLRSGKPGFLSKATDRVSGYLRISLVLSIAGLVICVLGLQAIVGTLLARLFGAGIATTPYSALQTNFPYPTPGAAIGGIGGVQPVDILVIQASANAMSALLASLIATVWLRGRLRVWSK